MAFTLASRASQHCNGLSPRSPCLSGPHTRHPTTPRPSLTNDLHTHLQISPCTPLLSIPSACCAHRARSALFVPQPWLCSPLPREHCPSPVTHSPRCCFCLRFPLQEDTDPRAANQGPLPLPAVGASCGTWQLSPQTPWEHRVPVTGDRTVAAHCTVTPIHRGQRDPTTSQLHTAGAFPQSPESPHGKERNCSCLVGTSQQRMRAQEAPSLEPIPGGWGFTSRVSDGTLRPVLHGQTKDHTRGLCECAHPQRSSLSQGGFSSAAAATALRPGHFCKDRASTRRGGRSLRATPRCSLVRCSLVRSGDPAAMQHRIDLLK